MAHASIGTVNHLSSCKSLTDMILFLKGLSTNRTIAHSEIRCRRHTINSHVQQKETRSGASTRIKVASGQQPEPTSIASMRFLKNLVACPPLSLPIAVSAVMQYGEASSSICPSAYFGHTHTAAAEGPVRRISGQRPVTMKQVYKLMVF